MVSIWQRDNCPKLVDSQFGQTFSLFFESSRTDI
jgi:hypothetical protein